MDIKRLKTGILLGMMVPILSSCSNDNIDNYLKKDYKILKAYEIDSEIDNDYYLVIIDNNSNESLQILGKFDSIEKAREYIEYISNNDKNKMLDGLIVSGAGVVTSLGFMIYNKKREKEEDNAKIKVLKR